MFPREISIDERVRASGLFPRIRDAEKKMKDDEIAIIRKGKKMEAVAKKSAQDRKDRFERQSQGATHDSVDSAPSEINPENYFSSFKLTDDPDLLKFLPYSELAYPKMFGNPSLRNSLDGIWVSGFLDTASKPIHVGMEECGAKFSTTAKASTTFDSTSKTPALMNQDVNPVHSSSKASVQSSSKSSVNMDRDIEKSVRTFKSSTIQTTSAPNDTDTASNASTNGSKIRNLSQSKPSRVPPSLIPDAVSQDQFSASTVSRSTLDTIKKRNKKLQDRVMEMRKPYEEMVKELVQGKPKVAPIYETTFISVPLEKLFEQQRMENAAAKKIQRCYRWSHMIHRVRFVVVAMRMTKKIQRVFRGYMVRKWVASWWQGNTRNAIKIQSMVRKYLSNLHLVPVLVRDQIMATRIQKIVRGKCGRCRFRRILEDAMVLRIQRFWRGLIVRMKCSKTWIDHVVVPIQTNVRRRIASKRVAKKRLEANKAALLIQRQFRSWSSCRAMASSIFNREMQYRLDMVTILTAEEEFAEEKLAKIASRLSRQNYKEDATLAANDMYNSFENVRTTENLYLDQLLQREIVSPRAIVQGWVQSLDTSIADLRKTHTANKLESIFDKVMAVETMENTVRHRMLEVDEVVAWRNCVSRWKEKEYAERLEISYQRETEAARKARRHAISDEKRRWKLRWFTPNGKPDRHRRPDRAWDPSILAGPEKSVYSGGHGVNLMAKSEAQKLKDAGLHKPGTEESVESTMAQYALQTYLDQVKMYEKLLNPIETIMKTTLGQAPDDPNTEKQLGYGPLGQELPAALAGIGAVPADWDAHRQEVVMGVNGYVSHNYDTVKDMISDRKRREKIRANSRGFSRSGSQDLFHNKDEAAHGEASAVTGSSDTAADPRALFSSSSAGRLVPSADNALVLAPVKVPGRVQQPPGVVARRRAKRAAMKAPAVIPWALLDELDGEKKRFANERNFFEFNNKFMTK